MLIEKGTDKAVYTVRVLMNDEPAVLGRLFLAIAGAGGSVGDIARVGNGVNQTARDVDVLADDDEHLRRILQEVGKLESTRIQGVANHVEEMHREGKITMQPRRPLRSISDVRKLYTPGVAYICKRIQADPTLFSKYTYVCNTVAIVTNGTAVLGLGDIGVRAGMPVMEGKAMLFSALAGVNGIPILVESRDPTEIVETVARIAPSFGAIQLEDIASPECFEVEDRLRERLDIPVLHDDQHATAVVVLACLINVCRYAGVAIHHTSVGIVGLGAAGLGIAKLLKAYGVQRISGTDLKDHARDRLRAQGGTPVDLAQLMQQNDVIIATTGVPGLIKPEMVRQRQVILALSNPNPEIKPEQALAAGALFAVDGRMVNNALAFPGLFRGALQAGAHRINEAMLIVAAETIANEADEGELVPNLLKDGLHQRVAQHVERRALETGANQKR
jgi:malate dehydrogenase (oxaloacetate-decarboxylating)